MSIYEELYGSDKYNGLVLGLMLLIGTIGALLPEVLPKIQLYFLPNTKTILDSKIVLYLYILFFFVLSSLLLIFSTLIWDVYSTITLLSIFFGLWQACTVMIFSELAQSLKAAFINQENEKEIDGDDSESNPPFSFAFVLIIAINIVFQIIIQGILFSWLEVALQFACLVFSIIFILMNFVYCFVTVYFLINNKEFFNA